MRDRRVRQPRPPKLFSLPDQRQKGEEEKKKKEREKEDTQTTRPKGPSPLSISVGRWKIWPRRSDERESSKTYRTRERENERNLLNAYFKEGKGTGLSWTGDQERERERDELFI